ncbi:hypothetical protein J5X84_36040 [Streptosporangiaceae bacterium NEAU-GS5]|nr:hypothetical protein [Streptosporangiaceae bacterium NEAU-GS5]
MNEYGPIRYSDAPVPIPPLVGYVPAGRYEEVAAWLLALKLAEDRKSWDCLICWVRTTPPLNGREVVHSQEILWVPQAKVRKLPGFRDEDYARVPRLRDQPA